ncbi:MAG: tol-pal system YbgF family protein [Kiritimatiellia bacterium]
MDEKIPDDVNETQPSGQAPIAPVHESEDLKQVSRWMAEYGRPALIGLAVAVVVVLGISIWRNQKAEKAKLAVQALFQGSGPEELQQTATSDPKAPTAPMALATAAAEFYAQGRYDESLSAYQSFLGQYPDHMLVPEAELGVAAGHEGLDDFETAAAGYEAFAKARAGHRLMPQATMGAARCREQLGQFAEARALYEDFIASNPDSSWLPQAESGLLFLKKAERAKNAPPQAVFDSSKDAVVVDEAVPAAAAEAAPEPAAAEAVPAATESAAAPAEEPAVDEAVPAEGEEKAAVEDAKPRKKKSSKKKAAESPAEEAVAEEPAAE